MLCCVVLTPTFFSSHSGSSDNKDGNENDNERDNGNDTVAVLNLKTLPKKKVLLTM